MKKTILFLNGHLDTGGCERSLVDVLKHIDYDRYQVDLLLLEHMGDYADELPPEVNVQLYSLDQAFGRLSTVIFSNLRRRDWFSLCFRVGYTVGHCVSRSCLRRLRRLFKRLRPSYDVIVAYRPGICTELAAYTFQARKKISWWHHGEMNFSGESAAELHAAYQEMDSIVAVSASSMQLVADMFPDIREKLTVIPNMIIPEELLEKSKEYEAIEFSGKEFKIVSVGRMSPEKNMTLCPQVAARLRKRGIHFCWVMIGAGEDEAKVSELLEELGLQDSVLMLGKMSNPYPYIASADVMVHPSLVESQGITLLEGMALNTPVVAVASEGPKEFIVSGENGYLVSDNAEQIAEVTESLAMDLQLRQRISESGKETAKRFSAQHILKQIENVLEV